MKTQLNRNFSPVLPMAILTLLFAMGLIVTSIVLVQSTIALDSAHGGTGSISLLLIYASMAVISFSSMPTQVISKLGYINALVVTSVGMALWPLVAALNIADAVLFVVSALTGACAAMFWSGIQGLLTVYARNYQVASGKAAAGFTIGFALFAMLSLVVTPWLLQQFNACQVYMGVCVLSLVGTVIFSFLPAVDGESSNINGKLKVSKTVVRVAIAAKNSHALMALSAITAAKLMQDQGFDNVGVALSGLYFLVALFLGGVIGRFCDSGRYGPVVMIRYACVGACAGLVLVYLACQLPAGNTALALLTVALLLLGIAGNTMQTAYVSLQINISPNGLEAAVSKQFLMIRNLGTVSVLFAAVWLPLSWVYVLFIVPMGASWWMLSQYTGADGTEVLYQRIKAQVAEELVGAPT